MIARTAPQRCRLPLRLLATLVSLLALLGGSAAHAGISLTWGPGTGFSPDTIGPGSTTTLTYIINNFSSTGVRNVAFTNTLPAGVTLADPACPTISCDGILSAPDGGTTISLTDGEVPGNGSCVITVNVTSAVPGTHTNRTGDLTSDFGNSGAATDDLTVDPGLPGFSKAFSPNSVGLGGRSTLTFTIDNSSNEGSRFSVQFQDQLPTGIVVANPPNISTDCAALTITAVPGSSTINVTPDFTMFGVPAITQFATCTVSVDVIAQAVGRLVNVSGELTSAPSQGGTAVSSGRATAALEVTVSPILFSKTFIDDPSTPGSTSRVEYTIVNRSRDLPLTNISFSDDVGAALPGLVATGLPANDWCGAGSLLTGTSVIQLTGGSLPPEGSCTFRVPLQVPGSAAPGAYPSPTSQISATLDGSPVTGSPASDTLFIDVAPELLKTFLPSTATPGDQVTLRFRITNNSTSSIASQIAFVDELPPELINANPLDDGFCGQNSTMTFTPASQFDPARLTISGAELAPGASCTFDVPVEIAPSASTGTVVNTTEPVTATIADNPVTGNAATASLDIISGPSLSKEFLTNPVVPGETSKLQYTLTYGAETTNPALDIRFTDDLGAILPGMVALGLPRNDICGPGSSVAGTSVIDFRGGSLPPGGTCSFIVEVLIPQEAPVGTITNTTSPVLATVGRATVQSGPASANLLISGLSLSKQFLSAAIPGSTVDLEFTITNDGNSDARAISFTDNLDDVIPGMTGVGLPLSNICGTGSSLVGAGNPANSLLVFQAGAVDAGTSCTFTVRLQVPASALVGSYVNSTSSLTATLQGVELPVTLPGAADTLEVDDRFLELTKSFPPGDAEVGSLVALSFTLTNIHPTRVVRDIAFTDALPGGLVSTAGTVNGICGPGSQLSGGTTLSVTVPLLNPGQSCEFSVPVSIPVGTNPGLHVNTTSDLSGDINGNAVRGDPAVASINVAFPFTIRGVREIPGGLVALTWTGTPGRLYCVEWTEDLQTWTRILPAFRIDTGITEWIDSGPPLTPSIPMSASRRFYRIVEKASP